ncbi:precorrin-2/cobalt-factor-2 C20-methyltransferase [Pseudoxanthobacter soli DSM 19599]|uniref:Precorrin-2/cobalt-factor-2 C20-methyltransferase n=1 Tax=Pseudoxanthobacter soli DSM 19599 TaxID=1123029 RepID=A0A1M7ZDD0_9HYPH|nr:precorrin-2 C(20)-methyltransferase [Pseudoxanthobacter soli]SHO62890.1 precorrin-2/cobalt-factor-2 C20-methyltransferase [Pseudoxanthobacter soli DSM 19599]
MSAALETAPGRLYGVGLGPGDPELVTLKAVRVLASADVIACFAKAGNAGRAATILANPALAGHVRPGVRVLALDYPVTTEIHRHHPDYRAAIAAFYDNASARVAAALDAGDTVAVVSEGDPLFYGSYMHLHVRLSGRYRTEVIPGVTAFSGCSAEAGLPLVQGDDVLTVLPGTLDEDDLVRHLAGGEAAVIMKLGRNLPKVRRALMRVGKLERALYVERGTMADGASRRLVDQPDEGAPYFSLVLVPGWEGRP